MSHAIEGWLAQSGPLVRSPQPSRSIPVPTRVPDRPGLWKYRTLNRSRWTLAFSLLFSAGLHALVLLGFNDRRPVPKPVRVHDEAIMQMVLPDLKEEEIDPVENLGDEPPAEAPSIAVPLLADIPSIVPIDAFVQPLDFTPALPSNLDNVRLSAIPVNVARNSSSLDRLGKIFDVGQLDRQPEPTFQPSPIFPPELKKEFTDSTVTLEFIITVKGEVVAPRSLASHHRRFEEAAIRAVEKWKFRPGYKGGRAVNTRTQISIHFRVTAD